LLAKDCGDFCDNVQSHEPTDIHLLLDSILRLMYAEWQEVNLDL